LNRFSRNTACAERSRYECYRRTHDLAPRSLRALSCNYCGSARTKTPPTAALLEYFLTVDLPDAASI
jgi:hypothetical protein